MMGLRKTTPLLCALFLLLAPAYCAPQGRTVVLEGARLIDGTGRPPLSAAVLVIEGNIIRSVGKKGSVPYPKDASVVDLRGKVIIPALINLHGHLGLTREGLSPSAAAYTEENIRVQLEKYLAYGVGAIVSLGTDQDLIYGLRDAQHAGKLPGARLYSAGRGFGAPGGYPPLVPGAVDRYRPQNPEEARAEVRELAGHRPDFVKIWVDDDFGRIPKMKPEIYRAIIDEAHRHQLRVVAHVFYLADAQALIDAGVDGLGHSIRDRAVSAELVRSMLAHSVFYIPTLVRDESTFIFSQGPQEPRWLADPFFQAGLESSVLNTLHSRQFIDTMQANPNLDKLQAAFEMAKRNLRSLLDAGVTIGLGTDSGPPLRFQGFFEHRELQLMVESGLSPMQAIVCATRRAAEVLKAGTQLGTLEPGKRADFLLLEADPLEDIRNTERLAAVWQAGRPVRAIAAR